MRVFIFMRMIIVNVLLYASVQLHASQRNISLIKSAESKNSFISYVTIDHVPYIVKQKKDSSKYLSAIRDALAAYIAQELGVAHSVQIVSSKDNFPGKRYPQFIATLLSIALGKAVRSQPKSKYYYLCLKQRNQDENLLPHRWFNETIIHQMTWHKSLAIIIGLDLFISNTDRHGGNIFYDEQTDTFCAIDMDNIYRRDLPMLAYKKLKLMIAAHKKFTQKEIEALTSVRDTIQFLLNRYSVKDLIDKLHFFIKQADFPREILQSKKMIKKIKRHETMIKKSRSSLYILIDILNKIISNASH